MADRYDMDRERGRDWDRERNASRDWDRNRDWGRDVGGDRFAGSREDWDRDRERRAGSEGRYGEGRYENYGQGRRTGDEGWRDTRSYGYERGDWGPQGRWGAYGNRADYNRENDWREGRGFSSNRPESDFGGYNTSRTNLYGTGGGGFGSGFSSYGAGMGGFSGGGGSYGGGMGSYGERERGRYTGRGPKGWHRSDDRIRDDINERLTDNPDVDASDIEVKVVNAEVTLTGTIDDRHAKRLAEDIAESVSGVRDVHNQIRVQQREPATQGAQSGATSTSSRNK